MWDAVPDICANAMIRWIHPSCYCELGIYYSTGDVPSVGSQPIARRTPWPASYDGAVSSSSADIGGGVFRGSGVAGTVANATAIRLAEVTTFCTVHGVDHWREVYGTYAITSCCAFSLLFFWCVTRLVRLYRRGSRGKLLKVIHFLCLAAAGFRIPYIMAEYHEVHVAMPSRDIPVIWEFATGSGYTCFFSLSAAAFLCICQQWLRLIYLMDETRERPWHRNPLYGVCIGLLAFESINGIWYLLGWFAFFHSLYYMWLSFLGVGVAVAGVIISRRLYGVLRMWFSDDDNILFRKTFHSATAVVGMSIWFMVLSVAQSLVGKWYAWPCLVCWTLCRLSEVAYLAIILCATSLARNQPTGQQLTNFTPSDTQRSVDSSRLEGATASVATASFGGDSQHGSFAMGTPNGFEAFFIGANTPRGTFEDDQWPDEVLSGRSNPSQTTLR